jgi:Serine dehydrogenase proteinase
MAKKAENKDIEIIKPPVLFAKTQELITKIEKYLGGKLICYWNSVNGSVCQNDVVTFNEILKDLDEQKKIYLFVKSAGGDGKASLRIVNLIRQHTHQVVALVPLECASAATMMVLGADEIQMGSMAYLSAVDTSLTHDLSPVDKNNALVSVSQDELSRVIKLWNKETKEQDNNPYNALYQFVHPLVIGAVDRASSLSIKLCKDILSYHMQDEQKADFISNNLNSSYPSHSYPILLTEAQKIGLNANEMDSELNDMLLDLNEIYSEMGQKAYTDYDEYNGHDHEILNIIEGANIQIHYQVDKDWHYRLEERRWIVLNDKSAWIKTTSVNGETISRSFHIR